MNAIVRAMDSRYLSPGSGLTRFTPKRFDGVGDQSGAWMATDHADGLEYDVIIARFKDVLAFFVYFKQGVSPIVATRAVPPAFVHLVNVAAQKINR